jgi:hypothetical protein
MAALPELRGKDTRVLVRVEGLPRIRAIGPTARRGERVGSIAFARRSGYPPRCGQRVRMSSDRFAIVVAVAMFAAGLLGLALQANRPFSCRVIRCDRTGPLAPLWATLAL